MIGKRVDVIFGGICLLIFSGSVVGVQCWFQEPSAHCCDNFTMDRACGIGGTHACNDIRLSDPSYQSVSSQNSGLSSYTNNTTVECRYKTQECQLIGCKQSNITQTGTCTDQTATGDSCSQPGPGGGGNLHPVSPVEPIDP